MSREFDEVSVVDGWIGEEDLRLKIEVDDATCIQIIFHGSPVFWRMLTGLWCPVLLFGAEQHTCEYNYGGEQSGQTAICLLYSAEQ